MSLQERGVILKFVSEYGDTGVSIEELKAKLGWNATMFYVNLDIALTEKELILKSNGNLVLSEKVRAQLK